MSRSILCLVLVLAGCGAESPEDWSWAAPPPRCPLYRGRCSEPDDWTDDETMTTSSPDAAPCPDGDAECSRVPQWKSSGSER